jgi:hypothetical protein
MLRRARSRGANRSSEMVALNPQRTQSKSHVRAEQEREELMEKARAEAEVRHHNVAQSILALKTF